MSDPANILDRFRSYSYHHILIACDNSQAANRIASNDFDVADFSQLGAPPEEVLGDIISTEEDEEGNVIEERQRLGNYVVLVNGLRDSRYTIQTVEWDTVTASSVNNTDRGNSLAVEGNMLVQEPRGFEFLNMIDGVQNAFDTDATGIIFLLKTVFVGHTDDSSLPTVISDIRPLQFMLLDITATFDAQGGYYKLKFVGLNNGASRLPQISQAGELANFTPNSRVLSEVLSEYSTKLTDKAREDYNTVRNAIAEHNDITEEDSNKLRRVVYSIVPQDPYDQDIYVLDNFDPQTTEDGTEESVGPIHMGTSFTVEQAIQRIMALCKRVQDELREGIEGVRYRYKITSSIEMTKISPDQSDNNTTNEEVLNVTYYIKRFPDLTNASITDLLGGNRSNTEVTEEQIRDNLITFEYLFTGKNVDIKNFDMKLNQGLLFLQTLRTTDNTQTQLEKLRGEGYSNKDVLNGQMGAKRYDSADDEDDDQPARRPLTVSSIRARTPIFPGTTFNDVVSKNIGQPENTSTFNAALQRHAALETLQTRLTIRGNPYLMSQTNKPAGEPVDERTTSDDEDRSIRLMRNWDRIPALAKINIRMPRNSETLSSTNAPDLVKFWYTGYYYIFSMKHKFDKGEFTQQLDMLSMPQNSYFEPVSESAQNDTGDTENNASRSNEADARRVTTSRETPDASQRQRAQNARQMLQRTLQPPPSADQQVSNNNAEE
jgi:hypothetical protein